LTGHGIPSGSAVRQARLANEISSFATTLSMAQANGVPDRPGGIVLLREVEARRDS